MLYFKYIKERNTIECKHECRIGGRIMTSYTKNEICKSISAVECGENSDCNVCIIRHLNNMSFNELEELIKTYKEVCITISDGRITGFNIL